MKEDGDEVSIEEEAEAEAGKHTIEPRWSAFGVINSDTFSMSVHQQRKKQIMPQ